MMAYFHYLLRHLPPPHLNTNDDVDQSPSHGGITVESDLIQLNEDPVRSDSLSIRWSLTRR